jgi:hypothetical protein
MMQKAIVDSSDSSLAMGTFSEASRWLSKMLKPSEKAIVPTEFVFEVLNPELKKSLIDCQTIWNLAGVQLFERSSKERVTFLQNWFNEFLRFNPEIKYVVRDWVDEYDRYLFENNNKLVSTLSEVETIPFTLSTGWSNKITIFEQVQYATALYENFSIKPDQFHVHPSNVSLTFDAGLNIIKNMQQVGFYLELKNGLSISKRSYALLNTTFNLENSILTIVFYYDKNRDGIFSGYNSTDYVKSGVFSQLEQGYISGKPTLLYQLIPIEPDPIVQIGFIASGSENGVIVLNSLTTFTETP